MGTQLDTLVVLIDDGPTAHSMLSELLSARRDPAQPMRALHLVVVACPPRMTHRMSKWLSHRTREGWRQRWQARLHEAVMPLLQQARVRSHWMLADGPLTELTQRLQEHHQAQAVLDMRRARLGDTQPDSAEDTADPHSDASPHAPKPSIRLGDTDRA